MSWPTVSLTTHHRRRPPPPLVATSTGCSHHDDDELTGPWSVRTQCAPFEPTLIGDVSFGVLAMLHSWPVSWDVFAQSKPYVVEHPEAIVSAGRRADECADTGLPGGLR